MQHCYNGVIFFNIFKLKKTIFFWFPSAIWHSWLGDRKGIRPVGGDILTFGGDIYAPLQMAPVTTATSIILSSNKIHNAGILVLANPGPPGKWPLKRRERKKQSFPTRLWPTARSVAPVTNANVCKKSSATADVTKVQLNTGRDQNSSLSSNHSESSSKNLSHLLFAFPWLSRAYRPDSRTFQVRKMWLLNSRNFQDLNEHSFAAQATARP